MTDERLAILIIVFLLAAWMSGPSMAGIERELKRIADALEKLERK